MTSTSICRFTWISIWTIYVKQASLQHENVLAFLRENYITVRRQTRLQANVPSRTQRRKCGHTANQIVISGQISLGSKAGRPGLTSAGYTRLPRGKWGTDDRLNLQTLILCGRAGPCPLGHITWREILVGWLDGWYVGWLGAFDTLGHAPPPTCIPDLIQKRGTQIQQKVIFSWSLFLLNLL